VQAVRSFLGCAHRAGVVVIVSDLGDPAWSKAVDHLLHERHDVGIVHLQTHGEIDLPLVGEQLDLVDGETGEILRGVTRAEMAAVRKRIRDERERSNATAGRTASRSCRP
jgi:hypothetical protein